MKYNPPLCFGVVVTCCTLLCIGCEQKPSETNSISRDGQIQVNQTKNSTVQTEAKQGDKAAKEQTGGENSDKGTVAAENQPETPVMKRADLDNYKSIFKGQTGWTYGERTPGELAGTWRSVDQNRHGLVFDVDGVPGTFSEDFAGTMTVGLYAISSTGKIVTVSSAKGASLGSHFQLNGDTITGPRGPDPSVEFRRVD